MTWQAFTILTLAAYRLTRLIGWDSISQSLRERALGVTDSNHAYAWQYVDIGKRNYLLSESGYQELSPFRWYVADLVHCPFCLGWWVSAALTFAWWATHDLSAVTALAIALAMSGVVGLLAKNLDP